MINLYPDRNAVQMQYTLDAHITDFAVYTTLDTGIMFEASVIGQYQGLTNEQEVN